MATVAAPNKLAFKERDFSMYPKDVGILAMDIVFPKQYVKQEDMEVFDGASKGKYTIGLGQKALVYCNDFEDIYSLCLSAVSRFMKGYGVSYKDIGRLEVATETIVDHSKAIKTVLMQLFEAEGNTDVEGIDCMNACYGGTNALFNSLAWVESSAWDGRYAMVVTGDIAEYSKGPARPTGGAGVVVMLIGPNAPLVIDRYVRASHMTHTYDFYKPNLSSPFPVVDGALSQKCYLNSLDSCYRGYTKKFTQLNRRPFVFSDDTMVPFAEAETNAQNQGAEETKQIVSDTDAHAKSDLDFFVFHAPYNKLVQKSVARLFYTDYLIRREENASQDESQQRTVSNGTAASIRADAHFDAFSQVDLASSYSDRALEQASVALSKTAYKKLVEPTELLPTQLGNMYTASLYAGLLSLIVNKTKSTCDETSSPYNARELRGKRMLCFSYGSGLASSLFSISVPDTDEAELALCKIAHATQIERRLNERVLRSPAEFNAMLDHRESVHASNGTGAGSVFKPEGVPSKDNMYNGCYYLLQKDDKGRKFYEVFQE